MNNPIMNPFSEVRPGDQPLPATAVEGPAVLGPAHPSQDVTTAERAPQCMKFKIRAVHLARNRRALWKSSIECTDCDFQVTYIYT